MKWVVTTAAEVGRAGAMKPFETVVSVIVGEVVEEEEEDDEDDEEGGGEVSVAVVDVMTVVWEVDVVAGGRGMGSRGEDVGVVAADMGGAGDEEVGEAVTWGLTMTVVVELWAQPMVPTQAYPGTQQPPPESPGQFVYPAAQS